MARVILIIAAAAWAVAGVGGLAIARSGTDALAELLPPLSIDRDALGRTVAALAIACLTLGLVHAAIVVGLARRLEWSRSAGTLLAGLLCAACVAGAAAALTSGAAGTMAALPALASALGAVLVAAGYGAAAVDLVGEMRSRSRG